MKLTRTCLYCETVCHARKAARRFARWESSGGRLRACRCPSGQGWHLTMYRPTRRRHAGRRPSRDSRLLTGGRRVGR
jgi:hypothetical protein